MKINNSLEHMKEKSTFSLWEGIAVEIRYII